MEYFIENYIVYLKELKHISKNTEESYRRDLRQFTDGLEGQGITPKQLNAMVLNSYLLQLEKKQTAVATIARKTACIKGYCGYLFRKHILQEDITERFRAPRTVKQEKKPVAKAEQNKLFTYDTKGDPLRIRSKLMLKVLMETDLQIEELLLLKTEDLNLTVGFLVCRHSETERVTAIGESLKQELRHYLQDIYPLLTRDEGGILFPNRRGGYMSRQGFWKNVKEMEKETGVKETLTLRDWKQNKT